jgi:hypothetical protein
MTDFPDYPYSNFSFEGRPNYGNAGRQILTVEPSPFLEVM